MTYMVNNVMPSIIRFFGHVSIIVCTHKRERVKRKKNNRSYNQLNSLNNLFVVFGTT